MLTALAARQLPVPAGCTFTSSVLLGFCRPACSITLTPCLHHLTAGILLLLEPVPQQLTLQRLCRGEETQTSRLQTPGMPRLPRPGATCEETQTPRLAGCHRPL